MLRGSIVTVEIDVTPKSLYAFSVVGLPDKAVDEARDRVSSALKNSGFTSPKTQNQKVVVSLAPADLKKEGSYFDLGIAIGYLLSIEEVVFDPSGKLFLGELALNGEVLPIKGVLPIIEEAKRRGFTEVFVPKENAKEAALIEGVIIYGVPTLSDLVLHINEKNQKGVQKIYLEQEPYSIPANKEKESTLDLSDIHGQETAKRALTIAIAGGHNIALYGPPGTGKTMLARAARELLPDLDIDSKLEATGIHSIAGTLGEHVIIGNAPFRSPHHTASHIAIIGGGTIPKPGEVTLAHHGILFMDEFPEFEKRVIESLRQPLEEGTVSISRAKGSAIFPARFILIAAMNPCPCGYKTSKAKKCICTAHDLARYERKLSGPIMDRIDLWVPVGEISYEALGEHTGGGNENTLAQDKIKSARMAQKKRFSAIGKHGFKNSMMTNRDMTAVCPLSKEVRDILNMSAEKLSLSTRAYHRMIKVARTIADLDTKDEIETGHILEALQYRPKGIGAQ